MHLDDFRQVWLAQFDVNQLPGERPRPLRIVAKEWRHGRVLRLDQNEFSAAPPYPLSDDVLFVAYDAPAALGCHLALGWPLPARILDLHAEFRCLTSGLTFPGDYDLPGALAHFGLNANEGLEGLLAAMLPKLDLPRAVGVRGRYMAAVARMEDVGVPIDMESLSRLREGWDGIHDALIQSVDRQYGVFHKGKFIPRRWATWVNRNAVPWPRHAPGRLDLRLATFRDMAAVYPEVRPMKELLASLMQLRRFRLAVGQDGRNRCGLRPFASKTGRNQPRSSEFIFGPAAWLRGLIQPREGMALAYLDYEQQEFGIAGALSGDAAMMKAYHSGDPYLAFAIQAGAVPAGATKATHRDEREQFKQCAIGVQYGMRARSLAVRLGGSLHQAEELLRLHRRTYSTYWRWSHEVGRQARRDGFLRATLGWTMHVGQGANPRSVRNFPLQANGAEMLRLACIALTEGGVRVCCPVHDALLIEAPVGEIDAAVAKCSRVMEWASSQMRRGFQLRIEAKVVRFPDRYGDSRGRAMWNKVFGLLDRMAAARQA